MYDGIQGGPPADASLRRPGSGVCGFYKALVNYMSPDHIRIVSGLPFNTKTNTKTGVKKTGVGVKGVKKTGAKKKKKKKKKKGAAEPARSALLELENRIEHREKTGSAASTIPQPDLGGGGATSADEEEPDQEGTDEKDPHQDEGTDEGTDEGADEGADEEQPQDHSGVEKIVFGRQALHLAYPMDFQVDIGAMLKIFSTHGASDLQPPSTEAGALLKRLAALSGRSIKDGDHEDYLILKQQWSQNPTGPTTDVGEEEKGRHAHYYKFLTPDLTRLSTTYFTWKSEQSCRDYRKGLEEIRKKHLVKKAARLYNKAKAITGTGVFPGGDKGDLVRAKVNLDERPVFVSTELGFDYDPCAYLDNGPAETSKATSFLEKGGSSVLQLENKVLWGRHLRTRLRGHDHTGLFVLHPSGNHKTQVHIVLHRWGRDTTLHLCHDRIFVSCRAL